MSGASMETELQLVMQRLGWRTTFLGEKEPAVDLLCTYPNPELERDFHTPGMTVYVQVKSNQQPTASEVGPMNLRILQRLQLPIFWYCISPHGGPKSRIMYFLSPDWLAAAIDSNPLPRASLPQSTLSDPLRRSEGPAPLQRFLKAQYASFLRRAGDAALAPFLGVTDSSAQWAAHIDTMSKRLRGIRPTLDIEVSLEVAKLRRRAGDHDGADALLQETAKQLAASSATERQWSRYWYERAYNALLQGASSRARAFAKKSAIDSVRGSIAQAVVALSFHIPVLKTLKLSRGYRRDVVVRLADALSELKRIRPEPADSGLRDVWVHNMHMNLAEVAAVHSLFSSSPLDERIIREFEDTRTYWLGTRVIEGIAGCLFVDALLAKLRNDRVAFDFAVRYFRGATEGELSGIKSAFLERLGGDWK